MQFPPLAPAHLSSMHKGGAMSSTQDQIAMMDKLRVHTDQYAARSKNSYMAMLDVWTDLEVGDDQQKQELQEVMSKALDCWGAAVSELKGRQQAVRDSIQRMLSDIMTIKEELGSDNPAADADLMRLQVRAWHALWSIVAFVVGLTKAAPASASSALLVAALPALHLAMCCNRGSARTVLHMLKHKSPCCLASAGQPLSAPHAARLGG